MCGVRIGVDRLVGQSVYHAYHSIPALGVCRELYRLKVVGGDRGGMSVCIHAGGGEDGGTAGSRYWYPSGMGVWMYVCIEWIDTSSKTTPPGSREHLSPSSRAWRDGSMAVMLNAISHYMESYPVTGNGVQLGISSLIAN